VGENGPAVGKVCHESFVWRLENVPWVPGSAGCAAAQPDAGLG